MAIIEKDIYSKGRFGAWLGIGGNIFLSLIKFLAGILGHSAAMVADAIHSLSDIFSSAIVLIGLKISQKQPDLKHPYGYSKAESVAAQVVSVFLVFLGGMIFFNSWKNIFRSDYQAPSAYVLLIAFVSITIKECLFRYKNHLGKEIHSSSLVVDAWHHRSDAFSSIAVLIGVFLALIGGPKFHIADHVAAMAVALIIFYTGIKMLLKTSSELMDQVLTGAEKEKIQLLVSEIKGVKAVEKLLIRKSGMDLIIDIHVEVNPDLSVVEGHNIAGKVKKKLMKKLDHLKGVMVHIEPYFPENQKSA